MDEQTQLWIKRLKDEIQNHNRYEARQLFYIDDNGLDREVKEHMTYGEWLREFNRFKVIFILRFKLLDGYMFEIKKELFVRSKSSFENVRMSSAERCAPRIPPNEKPY